MGLTPRQTCVLARLDVRPAYGDWRVYPDGCVGDTGVVRRRHDGRVPCHDNDDAAASSQFGVDLLKRLRALGD
jgi:hypothetical protein